MQVSWSRVKLARKCLKAHHYKYHENLTRKRKSVAPFKGHMLHAMLDGHINSKINKNYQGKDAWGVLEKYEEEYGQMFLEEQEEYGDIIGDCSKIFEGYLRMYKKDPLKYEESESFVATDLTDDIRLVGYLDKIATDSQGRRWIIDHKFVKTIPTMDELWAELQLLIYLWVWERWSPSKPVDGIIWDFARTKVPVEPEVLKRGGLSKRKNMDTDAHTYLSSIAKHNLDPGDYADMLELLEGNENKFYSRIKFPRPSQKMIDTIIQDFKATALMIQHLGNIAPRTMDSRNCKSCEFKELCEAEVRGLDADFIRKSKYTDRKNERETDNATEESE